MKIGNRKITGVSRRFYVVLGLVFFVVVALVVLKPKPEAPRDTTLPAFPVAQLENTKSGFLDQNVITQMTRVSFATTDYNANFGQAFKFRVFIPVSNGRSGRPDLVRQARGWSFKPAVFLDPKKTYDQQIMETEAAAALQDQPLEIGIRVDEEPAEGKAYELTGMLWWRSDQLLPEGQEDDRIKELKASPVFLIDKYEELSTVELNAPTTHQADLDLVYQEGPLQLDLKRIEWSSGREMRVCLSISNKSNSTVPLWEGLGSFTAEAGKGSVAGSVDPSGSLVSVTELAANQTVPGYVIFGPEISNPRPNMALRFPAMMPTTSVALEDKAEIGILGLSQKETLIKPISTDNLVSRSCTAEEGSVNIGGATSAPPVNPSPSIGVGGDPGSGGTMENPIGVAPGDGPPASDSEE